MSHTVQINNVEITNLQALRAAVSELQEKGVPITILENVVPNAYYASQAGMNTEAPIVLRSPQAPYDVAFYEKQNVKGQRTYVPTTDVYGGHVQRLYGNKHSPLGKLQQLYSVHAVQQQAARKGYRVQRKEQMDGTITLELIGG
jgi:hypothetical protein